MKERKEIKEVGCLATIGDVFGAIVILVLVFGVAWVSRFAKVETQSFDDVNGVVTCTTTYAGIYKPFKKYKYENDRWMEKDGDKWVPIRGTHSVP